MKKLLFVIGLACGLCSNGLGQNHFIEVMPFNPDVNSDFKVTSTDLMAFLGVYDTEFGTQPPSCDYDGSSFEEFYFGLMNMEIILDSMFVQYTLYDINEYYVVGCPETVTDTLEYTATAMMIPGNQQPNYIGMSAINHIPHIDGAGFSISMDFRPSTGQYVVVFYNNEIGPYLNTGFFGGSNGFNAVYLTLPFPEEATFDDNGLHLTSIWHPNDWPAFATEFVMLPYWHYAD